MPRTIMTTDRYLNDLSSMDLVVPDLARKNLPSGMDGTILTPAAQFVIDVMAYAHDLDRRRRQDLNLCAGPGRRLNPDIYLEYGPSMEAYANEFAARGLYLATEQWMFLRLDHGRKDMTDLAVTAASGYLCDLVARAVLKARHDDRTVRDVVYGTARDAARELLPVDVRDVLALIPVTEPVDQASARTALERYVHPFRRSQRP